MQKIKKLLTIALAFPRTVYFNFRYLPLAQAVRLPIWLAANVRLRNMYRGGIVIDAPVRTAMMRVGFHQVDAICVYSLKTILNIQSPGRLVFRGEAHIGHGAIISCLGGVMTVGDNFAVSGSTSFVCYKEITIGSDVQFAWDSLVMDSDAHKIYDSKGERLNEDKPIVIGNKVWLACQNTLLKGTAIGNNCVVGACSLLNKAYAEDGVIIAGSPARVVKEISGWEL
jgi:acetyltransferase-like isoleucine patch superfamily enzyme